MLSDVNKLFVSKVCWVCPAMFCLYTSRKLLPICFINFFHDFFLRKQTSYGSKTAFFLSLLVGTEIITNIRRFGIWDWWKHLMNSLDISFLSRTLVGSVESIAHHLWTKYYARKWGPSDINGFDIKMVGENQWHWFFFKSWQEHKKISLSELSNIGLFNHTLPWMTL